MRGRTTVRQALQRASVGALSRAQAANLARNRGMGGSDG